MTFSKLRVWLTPDIVGSRVRVAAIQEYEIPEHDMYVENRATNGQYLCRNAGSVAYMYFTRRQIAKLAKW